MPKQAKVFTTANDRKRVPFVLDKLYELFGENKEARAQYRTVAETIGVPSSSMINILADGQRTGVIVRRYTTGKDEHGKSIGKVSLWTLPYSREEAGRRFDEYYAKTPPHKGKQPAASQPSRAAVEPERDLAPIPTREELRKVAVRTNGAEPVEAIAGPEPTNPFESLRNERKDESAALIEAARQYSDRQGVIKRAFEELEKQGVTVDWAKIGETVRVDPDERLDTVAAILPYVDQLERQIKRLTEANLELRASTKGLGDLRDENRRLREQNQRLIAARVGNSAQAAQRT